MEVLGFKSVNFKANDGNMIRGLKIFFTDDSVKVDSGVACDSVFLSDGLLSRNDLRVEDIVVGQRLRLFYNKFGKIKMVDFD